MNKYAEMRNRQQAEVNAFPLGFAFSKKQFGEMMEKWGYKENETDKIYSIGYGGFIRREDSSDLHELLDRHEKEIEEAIADDTTGEGFIYEMFLYELDNHEYGYTWDVDSTLDTLGMTLDEVLADKRLKKGLRMAEKEIRKRDSRGWEA